MNRLPCLALVLLLAACGTPQEQCINVATRDMRVLDRLIGEAAANLDRGYGFETVTVLETDYIDCGTEAAPDRVCAVRRPEQERRPVAIDLASEQVKLDQLRTRRAQQATSLAPAIAQCKIENPA